MSRPVIICATCRPEQAKRFAEAWKPIAENHGASILFMLDSTSEEEIEALSRLTSCSVHNHNVVEGGLHGKHWIIPEGSSACKSWAIYQAWLADCDPIIVLDDDCMPKEGGDALERHRINLKVHGSYVLHTTQAPRARGVPYLPIIETVLSVGLWDKNSDVDGIIGLLRAGEQVEADIFSDQSVPLGALFPMSGMNLCFRREIAPLMYFGLQGPTWGVDRFDDIWCGWIAKRILDHLELGVWVGEPHIIHEKASDPFVNIVKEAPGYKMNNDLFLFMRSLPIEGSTPVECMRHVAKALINWGSETNVEYWQSYGEAVDIWCELFDIKTEGLQIVDEAEPIPQAVFDQVEKHIPLNPNVKIINTDPGPAIRSPFSKGETAQ